MVQNESLVGDHESCSILHYKKLLCCSTTDISRPPPLCPVGGQVRGDDPTNVQINS